MMARMRVVRMTLRLAKGFTLTEVVIVMAIVAILAALSYSGYTSSVQKARRAEAVTTLINVAARMEQFYAEHGVYTNDLTKLGFRVAGALATENGYYEITATTPTNQTFLLSAKRVRAQLGDTRCGDLTIDHVGAKAAVGHSDPAPAENCWE